MVRRGDSLPGLSVRASRKVAHSTPLISLSRDGGCGKAISKHSQRSGRFWAVNGTDDLGITGQASFGDGYLNF